MLMPPLRILGAAAALGAALLSAPGLAADSVLIFAAASTREAVIAVADLARQRFGIELKASFAGSSGLARQIESGAPADIFLSANSAWMDHVERAKAIDPGSRRDLARNRLVVIAPADAPLPDLPDPLTMDADLAAALDGGRLAVGETASVPAGIYARQALTTLGLWDSVARRLAPSADVRATLALVERGEVRLGVVYATDARASAKVRVVSHIPHEAHEPVVYPIAMTSKGAANSAAGKVMELFLSLDGATAFANLGFEPVAP